MQLNMISHEMTKLKDKLENPSPQIDTTIENFDRALKRGGKISSSRIKGRYHGYADSSRGNMSLSKRTAGTAG